LRSARSDVRAWFTSDSRPASRASSRCLMRAHTPQCSRQRRLLWASRGAVSRTLTLASEPRKAIGFLHPWGRLRAAPGQAQHGTASRHGCHGHPETRAARPHVSWGRACSMRCSRSHHLSNSGDRGMTAPQHPEIPGALGNSPWRTSCFPTAA
jgi:hypothetical protein